MYFFRSWQAIILTTWIIKYYRRHDRSKSSLQTFLLYVLLGHNCAAAWAGDAGTRHRAAAGALLGVAALGWRAFGLWHVVLDAEDGSRFVGIWFHRQGDALVLLLAQPACFEQRHSGAAVLAGDSTCPQIGDGGLAIYRWVEASQVGFSLL